MQTCTATVTISIAGQPDLHTQFIVSAIRKQDAWSGDRPRTREHRRSRTNRHFREARANFLEEREWALDTTRERLGDGCLSFPWPPISSLRKLAAGRRNPSRQTHANARACWLVRA